MCTENSKETWKKSVKIVKDKPNDNPKTTKFYAIQPVGKPTGSDLSTI